MQHIIIGGEDTVDRDEVSGARAHVHRTYSARHRCNPHLVLVWGVGDQDNLNLSFLLVKEPTTSDNHTRRLSGWGQEYIPRNCV